MLPSCGGVSLVHREPETEAFAQGGREQTRTAELREECPTGRGARAALSGMWTPVVCCRTQAGPGTAAEAGQEGTAVGSRYGWVKPSRVETTPLGQAQALQASEQVGDTLTMPETRRDQ